MKTLNITVSLLLLLTCGSAVAETISDKEVSYNLGILLGANIKKDFPEIDVDELKRGLLAAYKITDVEEFKAANGKVEQYQKARLATLGKKAGQAGEAYREKNAKEKGVKTTSSGLQYQVLTSAKGKKPKMTDTVKVHYKGQLIDGTEFDSSYKRGEPVSFSLGGVIKGWGEGLQLMNVGSKYRFVIPADLAYGVRGGGAAIGPNETLIFEVELLGIEDAAG